MSSVYIHIPFCISKCEYCDFFSIPCGKQLVPDSYVEALCHEIQFRSRTFKEEIQTVYIGGGTPSLLRENQLFRLISCLREVNLAPDCEITVEVNPQDVSINLLENFHKAGINRISCGVQALDEKILSDVKRRSSMNEVISALELLKSNWNGIFSADIISALPGQTADSFLKGLELLVSYKPSHISMYSLTIEEETPLGKKLETGKLNYDFDKADEIWLKGRDFLRSSGYVQYEVSNFYHKECGNSCRHNMVYWKLEDYTGIGSGAAGTFYGQGLRYTNTKDIQKYVSFWNNLSCNVTEESVPCEKEIISTQIQCFEYFMMGLRTLEGVSLERFERRFKRMVPLEVKKIMEKWVKNQNAVFYKNAGEMFFALNEEGILFLNSFLEEIIGIDF